MGNYLTSPNSTKHTENGEFERVRFGTCAMQGWRITMEDAHLVYMFDRLEATGASAALFGVYDGHGGPQVSHFVRRHVVEELLKSADFRKGRFEAAFRSLYITLDQLLGSQHAQPELGCLLTAPEPVPTSPPVFLSLESNMSQNGTSQSDAVLPPVSLTSSVSMTSGGSGAPPCAFSSGDTQEPPGTPEARSPHPLPAPSLGKLSSGGFRSSVKLGSKKLYHRVGHPKKKTRHPSTPKPLPQSTPPTEEPGITSTERQSSWGSRDGSTANVVSGGGVSGTSPLSLRKRLSGVRKQDGPNEEIQGRLGSGVLNAPTPTTTAITGPPATDLQSLSEVSTTAGSQGTATPLTAGASSSSSSSPSPSTASNGNSTTPNGLFSLQGIKSILSGLFKWGSPLTRHGPVAQGGLAMLAGCTAVTALITDTHIVVANAGDSRCVLCRNGTAIELSRDHKPSIPEERARIYAAGGWLEMGRVNGNLNLSRALGDLVYKGNPSLSPEQQVVSAVPETSVVPITDEDQFLIIGCDGVWESSTSQEIVNFVRERLDTTSQLSDILVALFEELLSPNPTLFEFGCDNMTAILVDLRRHGPHGELLHTASDELDAFASSNLTPAELDKVSPYVPTRRKAKEKSLESDILPDQESFWTRQSRTPYSPCTPYEELANKLCYDEEHATTTEARDTPVGRAWEELLTGKPTSPSLRSPASPCRKVLATRSSFAVLQQAPGESGRSALPKLVVPKKTVKGAGAIASLHDKQEPLDHAFPFETRETCAITGMEPNHLEEDERHDVQKVINSGLPSLGSSSGARAPFAGRNVKPPGLQQLSSNKPSPEGRPRMKKKEAMMPMPYHQSRSATSFVAPRLKLTDPSVEPGPDAGTLMTATPKIMRVPRQRTFGASLQPALIASEKKENMPAFLRQTTKE